MNVWAGRIRQAITRAPTAFTSIMIVAAYYIFNAFNSRASLDDWLEWLLGLCFIIFTLVISARFMKFLERIESDASTHHEVGD